ncbi:MAG: c-type cytochrome [Flavobacteriales bacterium]|nr:c-type cytochrome [Flavobacteriales bacterium]
MKTRLKYLVILILWINSGGIFAQDGEALFKAKCSTCHKLGGDMTGPNLKGVKQKWADAGEADLLYEWVKNSKTLIDGGKSQMALAIKDYDASVMSPQVVTNADVDAILDFVDNWTPPVADEKADPTNTAEPEVVLLPNYETNLTVFYALVITAIILLIAIAMMSGAIKRFIGSDYFKERFAKMNPAETESDEDSKSGGLKNLVLVIIGTTFIANSSNALDFLQPGEAVDGQPWLLVENSDLYALVGFNVLLVGVLLYMRRLFNNFVSMVTEEKTPEEIKEDAVVTKVNKILTDAVAIEDEETILLHHEYDGIRELDNNLPPWWVWMFYGTIIFGVIYIFNYHILGTSDLQIEAYEKEVKQAEIEKEAYLKAMAMNIDETNAVQMTDAADLTAGKKLFEANCVTCHSANGEGNIGPNLTDKSWIYGYDIASIYKTIRAGSPNNKMPEHESKLNPVEIQQVASFVMSLPYAEGNAPQGDIIEEDE